jgi:hypothetical protein
MMGVHGALLAYFCRIVRMAACQVTLRAVTTRKQTVKAAFGKTLAQTTPNVLLHPGFG